MISYDEAKAQLVTVLDETAEAVGGEWTVDPIEGEGWCNFDEGIEGKNFTAYRAAPPSGDPQAVAEQVRADWEARGFDVTTRLTPDPDVHEVNANGSGGFHIHLSSSAASMILTGKSTCIRVD